MKVRGYGQFSAGRVKQYAHRAALELALGRPIRDGFMACHHCDNRSCCNPAHLYEGTAQTNHDDMVARDRDRTGLGTVRQDMTRKWTAVLRDRGIEAAAVSSDEYAGWMAESSAETASFMERLTAGVRKNDRLDMEHIA